MPLETTTASGMNLSIDMNQWVSIVHTVWRESLVGGNFGELTHFEHLAKENLAN